MILVYNSLKFILQIELIPRAEYFKPKHGPTLFRVNIQLSHAGIETGNPHSKFEKVPAHVDLNCPSRPAFKVCFVASGYEKLYYNRNVSF